MSYLTSQEASAYVSILGLIVSVGGFVITIKTVMSSKKAAEQAKEAVRSVKVDLRRRETVSDFSAVLALLDEIKRINRQREVQYELLAERYSGLRKSLIQIRGQNPLITEADEIVIQDAITQLASFERMIDDEISDNKSLDEISASLKTPRHNKIISSYIDSLQAILLKVQHNTEVGHERK